MPGYRADFVPKITPRYIWNKIGPISGRILAHFAVTFYGLSIGYLFSDFWASLLQESTYS
jgi:hypothetical protein